jgi:nucleoside-diphosphate-sugar epimerase
MRVLVTGGGGFIGTHLIDRLAELGHDVTVLDTLAPLRARSGVRYVTGDVRDAAAVSRALEGCARVVHLAAAHHDHGISDETFYDVNERGTRVVCDAMAREGVSDIVFTSSAAVYGGRQPAREVLDLETPYSAYGCSKLAGERVLAEWAAADAARRALVVRPPVVIGPDNYANMYFLIRQISARRYLQVGSGTNRKSMAFVGNLVDFMACADGTLPGAGFRIVNYVDKPDLRTREIAAVIHRALERPLPRVHVPWAIAFAAASLSEGLAAVTRSPMPVTRDRLAKFARHETVLQCETLERIGWRPRETLEQGIEAMVRWYRTGGGERWVPPRFPPAVREVAAAAGPRA